MIKKPIEITIPARLYRFLIATWCAVVVGAIVLLGHHASPEQASADNHASVEHLQGVIQDLHGEVRSLREALAEHEPEHELLLHYEPE